MSVSLATYQARLKVHSSVVQQNAVLGLFQLLSSNDHWKSKDGRNALKECFRSDSKAVVDTATEQLYLLVQSKGFPWDDAVEVLMSAIPRTGGSTIGSLVSGVASLCRQRISAGAGASCGDVCFDGWSLHPLVRVAHASEGGHAALCCAVVGMLGSANRKGGHKGMELAAALEFLLPFINYALLARDHTGSVSRLCCTVHSALVRLACTCPPLRPPLGAALLRHLRWHPLGTAANQLHTLQAVEDTVDVWMSDADADGSTSLPLASVLLHVLCDAAAKGLPLLLYLSPIHRLGISAQHSMTCAVTLTSLALSAGQDEVMPILTLVAKYMQEDQRPAGSQLGLMAYPLSNLALLHTAAPVRQAALQLLRSCWSSPGVVSWSHGAMEEGAQPCTCTHGLPLVVTTCTTLLEGMADQETALRWLDSVIAHFRTINASGGNSDARPPPSIHPAIRLLLGALLYHPHQDVQLRCMEAIVEAARKLPLEGINFFPPLLYRLQATGSAAACPLVQQHCLQTIFSLAHHPTCLTYVLRLINQLAAAGSPPLIRSLSMRLLLRLWQTCSRAWPQLHDMIAATSPDRDDVTLQLCRAACIRDVTAHEPEKGLQLVKEIQDCLQHSSPVIQSLGLECISLLCCADVLDFYAAWRVVVAMWPAVPSHPMPAQQWVGLLSHGSLDAEAYPDKAAAVVDLLWHAAGHSEPQVRRAAHLAMASYPFDTLEAIEALRPGADFAQLLVKETDEAAREAAEKLVQAALLHEHQRRRRHVGVAANRAAAGFRQDNSEAAAVMHRLTYTLPRMLSGKGGSKVDSPSPGARLPFYAPPPPPDNTPHHTAALQAVKQYGKVFRDVIEVGQVVGSWPRACHAVNTWRPFINRWALAAAAALKDPATREQLLGSRPTSHTHPRDGAFNYIWGVLEDARGSAASPVVTENCAWAAAALCCVLPSSSRALGTQIVGYLRSLVTRGASGMSSCAGLVGLAAVVRDAEAIDMDDKVSCCRLAIEVAEGSTSCDVRSTACESGAIMLESIVAQHSSVLDDHSGANTQHQEVQELCVALWSALRGTLGMLWPRAQHSMRAAATAAPTWLSDSFKEPQGSTSTSSKPAEQGLQDICSCMAGLSHAASAVSRFAGDDALSMLCELMHALQRTAEDPRAATNIRAAACTPLPPLVLHCYAKGKVDDTQVLSLCSSLVGIVTTCGKGGLAGAAAIAVGGILNLTLGAGLVVPSERLSELMRRLAALAQEGGKMGADAKAGAAIGMCCLLGATHLLPGCPASASWLLTKGDHIALVKEWMQALEALSCKDVDIRCRSRCATALGLTCLALQGKKEQPSGGTGVSGLPADSCMRRAVEWLEAVVQQQQGRPDGSSQGVVCSVLTCLAAAPRLPATNWGALLKKVARNFETGEGEVSRLCAEVAVNHGGNSRLQLIGYLEEVVADAVQDGSHGPTQRFMAQHLEEVLPLFSSSKSARFLNSLVQLCAAKAQQALQLEVQESLWHGLRSCLQCLQQPQGWWTQLEVAPAVLQAVRISLASLPLPPPFSACALQTEPSKDGSVEGVDCGGQAVLGLWRTALYCLTQLAESQRLQIVPDDAIATLSTSSAPFLIARCCLVKSGALSTTYWPACRNALLNSTATTCDAALPQLIMPFVAAAATAAKPAAWMALWNQCLADMKMCTAPLLAFQLSVAMAAHRLDQSGTSHLAISRLADALCTACQPHPEPANEAHPTVPSCGAAVAGPIVQQALREELAEGDQQVMQQLFSVFQNREHWESKMAVECAGQLLVSVRGCLLEMRDVIPNEMRETTAACDAATECDVL